VRTPTLSPIIVRSNIINTIAAILFSMVINSCDQTGKNNNVEVEKLDIEFERAKNELKKDPLLSLNNDSIKQHFGNKYLELRTIVNKHDPIGLIGSGAPQDEYEPEVKTIIVQLNDKQSKEQIHDLVYAEFLRWFDDESTAGPKSAYDSLAADIYNWKNK
jgi:hypothetical protein